MIENTLNNECPITSEGCCVEFGNELVLDDLTFSVTEGSLVAVVGPNGGGKTTLFNVISGLIPVTHGSIKIKGLSPQESEGVIGYVPQNENVNWNFSLTARQIVTMGLTKKNSFLPITSKKNKVLIEMKNRKPEFN